MPHVRNAWYVVGWTVDLAAAKPVALSILDEPIVLYRTDAGRIVALEDRCVHRLAPLSLGRCEGENLRCMYHGLLFDPAGRCVEIPGQEMIPPKARVRTYPIVAKHGWLWIWMGDPLLADEALIPPVIGHDDPDWLMGRGDQDWAVDAALANNNLLDFSHLPFVHAASFGVGEVYALTQPKVTLLDRGVRVDRWFEDSLGPVGGVGEVRLDHWLTYDLIVPGILLNYSGMYPAGTAKACNHERPDYRKAVASVSFTSQAVTPMTARSTRYFYCWGPHRDHGDEALRDALIGIQAQAFTEDKAMIEAQQRIVDLGGDPAVMPTAHDRPVTAYNKVVEQLAEAERNTTNRAA
jgi:vanillate O-demethylase monooxygenase subunit